MPENFGADANARFSPPWLWVWFNLNFVKKDIWHFCCFIIVLSSMFDSSEKAAMKAIDKPTEIHLQN